MKRPLFLFFVGLVLGEAAAILLNRVGFFVMALFLLIFILGCSGLYPKLRKKRSSLFIYGILFCVLFVIGGLLFFKASCLDKTDILLEKKEPEGTLYGEVEFVKETSEGEYQLTLRNVLFKGGGIKRKLKGKSRILKIPVSKGVIYPGDWISCTGRLGAIEEPSNPGEFNSRLYYYSQGIYYQFFGKSFVRKKEEPLSVYRMAGRMRKRMDAVYKQILSKKEYGLLKAMFLGDKTDLSKEQKLLYQDNGVAHLLAVSGLHIAIVGGMLFRFLRKRGYSYAFSCILGSSILLFYAIMTGFGNSVFRAAIMFLCFLVSQYFGAEYDMVSSMSLAGILMLFDSPWRLLESGCIISFASVFSIGMILPFVKELEEKQRVRKLTPGEFLIESSRKRKMKQTFFANFILSMTIMPLILRFYYQWSPYSLLLNLFVIPAMTPLLMSAIAGGLFGIFYHGLGFLGCIPAVGILRSFEWVLGRIQKLPASVIVTGCPSWWTVIFLYVLLLLLFLIRYYRFWSGWIPLVLLLMVATYFFQVPSLKVTMLDVGQGECLFFRMPSGETILIDGGSTSKKNVADYTIHPALKYYGTDHLDYVIITHTDEDHISGIRELLEEKYPIKTVILPDTAAINTHRKSGAEKNIADQIEESGSQIIKLRRGDQLNFGKVKLCCLHPVKGQSGQDANSDSLVFYLSYGKFSMLLTGDLPGEREPLLTGDFSREKDLLSKESKPDRYLLKAGVTILKVAHHGSKNSTTGNFIKQYLPRKAILSAGKNNLYGHPHKETIERLQKQGTDIYGTLWGGAISIESDGQKYHINYFNQKENENKKSDTNLKR